MKLDWFSPYDEDEGQPLFILTNNLQVLADFIEEYSDRVEEDAKKCYEITNYTPGVVIIVSAKDDLNLIYAKNHTAPEDTIRLKLNPFKMAAVSMDINFEMDGAFFINFNPERRKAVFNGRIESIDEFCRRVKIPKERVEEIGKDVSNMVSEGKSIDEVAKEFNKQIIKEKLNSMIKGIDLNLPPEKITELFRKNLEKEFGKETLDKIDKMYEEAMADPEKCKELNETIQKYKEDFFK
jgi:hypothetical protein